MVKEKTHPCSPCDSSEHGMHLCALADKYFHVNSPDKFKAMVLDAEFKCQFCGRTANDGNRLCYPVPL